MLIANLGLAEILRLSIPVLNALYPVAIVLIALSFVPGLEQRRRVYPLCIGCTAVQSIAAALPFSALSALANALPLAALGFGWVFPAAAGLLAGILLSCTENKGDFTMIQPIMHDPLFLAQKSAPATPEDAPVARDLLETLTSHADGCVGMAANMIGVLKRIIAVEAEDGYLVLFNPVILKKSGQYEAEEGCLSLEGVRKTKRYQSIKVQYQTMDGKPRIKTFTGWTAQIIQHEIDHCDGILI